MPGTGTFITLGAVGAAGAAVYMNKRRNSTTSNEQSSDSYSPVHPHTMARRRSSGLVQNDLYEARKQVSE